MKGIFDNVFVAAWWKNLCNVAGGAPRYELPSALHGRAARDTLAPSSYISMWFYRPVRETSNLQKFGLGTLAWTMHLMCIYDKSQVMIYLDR